MTIAFDGDAAMTRPFVHLHVHSHFSLLDGLAKIDELAHKAAALGQPALALTDHGALYGAVPFYQACKKAGIKPIIGVEAYVAARTRFDKEPQLDSQRYHLTLLARTNEGYQNLVKLVTKSWLEGFYYKPRVDKDLLREHAEGLIALSGCISGEIGRAILSGNRSKAEKLIAEYQGIFGAENFYLELGANPNMEEQRTVNTALVELSRTLNVPLVATNDVHYLNAEDADAHEVLLSVQTGKNLSDENRLSLRQDDFSLCDVARIEELFPDIPEVIENTVKIAERCNIELPLGKNRLPVFPLPEGTTPEKELRRLCEEGLISRFGIHHADDDILRERLEYELSVISTTGFASYFLIVADVVNWSKQHGIVVGPGRGSAAGSLVSYVLNITNADPIRYGLLFERFLNPERISMPDIDLDFADYRRDEVLRYVTEKYGADRVAQIGTFGTMAARAVIRDAGRALGLPYGLCDRVAKLIPFGMSLEEALLGSQEFKETYDNEREVHDLVNMGKKLEGVARHVSTHACGVVIANEPLHNVVPLQRASTDDDAHTITQFEMHAIEDVGLLKMDFLGLRNLSIIEDTLGRVKEAYGTEINIDTIPLDDEKTFALLARGDTTGVFQLESGGMRRYLKDLKPTELEDIIAMVALYRPGPMELLPSYIARKHGREEVTYLHPSLKPVLGNTYGIGIYQEQMMRIATDLARYTLPEADTLRKAIGKKIKSLLDEQEQKLKQGMIANGISEDIAEAIWELFPPFARYGFPKAHATCYALIAYQTAYLKANYPYEFMAALFTHEGTQVERTATLISESRAHGMPVLPPDINTSRAGFTVAYSGENAPSTGARGKPEGIRFGLVSIKNAGANVVERIVQERLRNGIFTSVEDFLVRIAAPDVNKKSLEALIMAGAMDSIGERRQLLSGLDALTAFIRDHNRAERDQQASLFGGDGAPLRMTLPATPPATRDEKLRWEKELLGLWVSEHPLEDYAVALRESARPIKAISEMAEGATLIIGGIITSVKKIVTKSGHPMLFVGVEDLSDQAELIVFPRVYEQIGAMFQENAVLLFNGTVKTKDGETKLLVNEAKRLVAM